MPRSILRLFAIVLLLGQLVQVSGGAFCALQRRGQAAHCEDGMAQPAGASVTAPLDGMASAFCNLMGPCGAPVPAVTAASFVNHLLFAETQLAASAGPSRPESFHPVPIPPPPQV
jgi:hypothetical protein